MSLSHCSHKVQEQSTVYTGSVFGASGLTRQTSNDYTDEFEKDASTMDSRKDTVGE